MNDVRPDATRRLLTPVEVADRLGLSVSSGEAQGQKWGAAGATARARRQLAQVRRGRARRLAERGGGRLSDDAYLFGTGPDLREFKLGPGVAELHLNLLHDIFKTAKAEELVDSNPVDGAERPKVKARRWRILEPVEVARVHKAFTDEQARVIFLTLMLTGIRRFELQAIRWCDVDLVESVLRVRESKSEEGERSIALSPMLAEELWQHRRRSAFQGDDERVFCHPKRGSKIDHEWYAGEFRAALKRAGISDYIRPFHDARHASLTNGAVAGESPIALMSRAGHRSMQTTKTYLHLAGTVFPDEAAALEQRLLGGAKLHQTEPTSDDLSEPESADHPASAP